MSDMPQGPSANDAAIRRCKEGIALPAVGARTRNIGSLDIEVSRVAIGHKYMSQSKLQLPSGFTDDQDSRPWGHQQQHAAYNFQESSRLQKRTHHTQAAVPLAAGSAPWPRVKQVHSPRR